MKRQSADQLIAERERRIDECGFLRGRLHSLYQAYDRFALDGDLRAIDRATRELMMLRLEVNALGEEINQFEGYSVEIDDSVDSNGEEVPEPQLSDLMYQTESETTPAAEFEGEEFIMGSAYSPNLGKLGLVLMLVVSLFVVIGVGASFLTQGL